MSDNTNSYRQGFTAVEILIAIVVGGIVLTTFFVFSFSALSGTIRNSNEARLAVDSQTLLRSLTEEIRTGSGIHAENLVDDPSNPGGWTTSNPDLVLIVSTPALDAAGEFIQNETEGGIFLNEIVYYADGSSLYKRTITDPGATNNRYRTSCPVSAPDCPQDVLLSNSFKDMSFVFYDQDDQITTDTAAARSVKITVLLERQGYGQVTTFTNSVRVTMRNNIL